MLVILNNPGLDALDVVNLRVGGFDSPTPGSIIEPFTALVRLLDDPAHSELVTRSTSRVTSERERPSSRASARVPSVVCTRVFIGSFPTVLTSEVTDILHLMPGTAPRLIGKGQLYYGWILVATLGVTETTSWGVLYYAFTVFIAPMQQTFHWSRSTLTGAFSLALLLSGLVAVPVGRWLDHHGPRALMTAGSCAAVLLLLAWSRVNTLLGLYLVWAGIGIVLAAVLYEPAFVIVATWFRRKRGRALTLLTFMGGFASVIFVPLAGWLVARQGWREALVTLAIIVAVVTIPLHAFVLRRRPEDRGLLPDGALPAAATDIIVPERSLPVREALHGSTFWWLTAAFFLNTLGVGALFVHLVPYLTDHGYGKEFAAGVTGLVGVMALPGRLVLTPLGDRLPRSWVACGIFVLQVLALLLLLLIHSGVGVVGFVVLFGAGFGAVTPARAALVAEFYGPASYGSISGVLSLFLTGARAIAPVGAGILYDVTGGYNVLLWGLTVASAVAAVAVLVAERSAKSLLEASTPRLSLPGR